MQKIRATVLMLAIFAGMILAGGGVVSLMHAHAPEEAVPALAEEPQRPESKKTAEDKSVATVTVCHPVTREFTPYQTYTGRLEALQTVQVRARASAVLEEVCFQGGTDVQKGQILFRLDTAPRLEVELKRAQADLDRSHAEEELRAAELKRLRELVQKNAVGEDTLAPAIAREKQAAAAVGSCRALVLQAQQNLDYGTIRAPITGRIGLPQIDPGNMISASQEKSATLATITVIDPIRVRFDMDENGYLAYQRLVREQKIKGPGNKIFMALSDEQGYPHAGVLDDFDNRVDVATGTIHVRGHFPNPNRLFLPGMFARVRLTTGAPRHALFIPEQALMSDQSKRYVYIVNGSNKLERRDVGAGQQEDDERQLWWGVTADDWVVTRGMSGLPASLLQQLSPVKVERVTPQKK
jgi:RND family efflux transporter MFP subunit